MDYERAAGEVYKCEIVASHQHPMCPLWCRTRINSATTRQRLLLQGEAGECDEVGLAHRMGGLAPGTSPACTDGSCIAQIRRRTTRGRQRELLTELAVVNERLAGNTEAHKVSELRAAAHRNPDSPVAV